MTLQVIDKKKLIFRGNKSVYQFVKPKYLMPESDFRLIEAKAKGSTMVWYIQNETLSYNQVRSLFS